MLCPFELRARAEMWLFNSTIIRRVGSDEHGKSISLVDPPTGLGLNGVALRIASSQ
jgi:hypothetical protein